MTNVKICRLHAVLLALSGILVVTQCLASVELVQSVPIETTLEVPGIADTQQVWISLIDSAKKTLDVEQFYISEKPGQSLTPVIAAVKAAAGRGVKVRFLID